MSKMSCHCGGVISDVVVPSPTEGWLFREQDEEGYYDVVCGDIVSFFAAVREGRREDWIRQFFTPEFPTDIGDESMVHAIITFHARRVKLSVCECSECGRLYVQKNNGVNSYLGYADEPGYKGVLRPKYLPPTGEVRLLFMAIRCTRWI